MTFCLAVVEKAEEPFILPWISPNRSMVCRISDFGSMVDDSVSRRGSGRSETRQMSEKPMSDRPTPGGPRPLGLPSSVATEPVLELRLPEDDLLLPDTDEFEPALKLPEPTLPLLSDRYQPEAPSQSKSADWKHDWSIFAGEAGLRASGTSTVADMSTFAESSVSGSSQPLAPAPYSVWTPTKPSQPAPAARSYRSRTLISSSSKRLLLPTLHEVRTPTSDIFDFMGGYAGQDGAATLRDEARSDSGAKMSKPRGSRTPPKVTVEDVPDEAFTVEQPGPKTPPKKQKLDVDQPVDPAGSKTPKIPGSFVEDYPVW